MAETFAELLEEGKDVTKCLTTRERERLTACEKIIEDNIQAVVKVGEALAEIRDHRLYRAQHNSFERYCKDVWDFSKNYANKLVRSSETINLLSEKINHGLPSERDTKLHKIESGDHGTLKKLTQSTPTPPEEYPNNQPDLLFEGEESPPDPEPETDPAPQVITLPQNERQIRPLTKLKDPEERVKAWDLVIEKQKEGKKLTAWLVQECVRELKGEAEEEEKKVSESKKAAAKADVEKKGKEVQDSYRLTKLFRSEYQKLLQIVYNEKMAEWTSSSKEEVVKWLRELVEIAENDDY